MSIHFFYPLLLVFQQSLSLLFLDHLVFEVIMVLSDSSWRAWLGIIDVRLVVEVALLVSEAELLRTICCGVTLAFNLRLHDFDASKAFPFLCVLSERRTFYLRKRISMSRPLM